jgi:hypothetical protein
VQRCPVLYVVGEGAHGLDDRVSAWEQAWRQPVEDEDLIFAVKPDSLASHRTWTELTAVARDLAAGFIVLDTFSSLASDADETKDAPLITRWLSDLAVTIDGTALLIHHPGWGDVTRARGGSQLEANADEVLILHGSAKSDLIELERKKVKEGPAGDKMWLRRRPLYGSVVIETASAADSEVPLRDQVLAMLAEAGDIGMTGPQILRQLGMEDKRSTVYKVLGQLVGETLIGSEGARGRARYRALPDE